MRNYIRHLIAMAASLFGSHVSMAPGALAQDQDGLEWNKAKAAGTLEALEDYLARNPVGPYSREAFKEIIRRSDCDQSLSPNCADFDDFGSGIIGEGAYRSLPALY